MELLNAVTPLLGVLIGGVITYCFQNQLETNREKRRERTEKIKAYSQILKIDVNTPLLHGAPSHIANGFIWETYEEKVRPLLFDNLHLFEQSLVDTIIQLDGEQEQIEITGEKEKYQEKQYKLYKTIIVKVAEELRAQYDNM